MNFVRLGDGMMCECYTCRMAKAAVREVPPLGPEECLQQALGATTAAARVRLARTGLAAPTFEDLEIQGLLLRELHRGLLDQGLFEAAEEAALQGAAVFSKNRDEDAEPLEDVLLQAAARAALARGDGEAAIAHVQRAARKAPKVRRAFHHWTLGSLLFLAKRYTEAAAALARASRLSGTDAAGKALYRGHLALVKTAQGEPPADLQATVNTLAAAPTAAGYGSFVLGHLAYAAGEFPVAERYLRRFLAGTNDVALAGEIAMSQATLAKITEG
jgi:tetratricopeptide (TPR) repeat protein